MSQEVITYKPTFDNLNLWRYLNPQNMAEIRGDLGSLLAEMQATQLKRGATVRDMVFVENCGFFHKVGEKWIPYVDYFGKAIEDTTSQRTKERFKQERVGWNRAEGLVQEGERKPILIASPPGETYRFQGITPLSASFLFVPKGEIELTSDSKKLSGLSYDAWSIYTDEKSPSKHIEIITDVAYIPPQFLEIVKGDVKNIDANMLVALPWILKDGIDRLDNLSTKLGFESWSKLESRALKLKKLYEEDKTDQGIRRQAIISMLEELVMLTLTRKRDIEIKQARTTILEILAKEAYGYYIDKEMTIEQIRQDIQLTMVLLTDRIAEYSVETKLDPFTYQSWRAEREQLMINMRFKRMLSVHGGGIVTGQNAGTYSLDSRTNALYLGGREKKTIVVKCKSCEGIRQKTTRHNKCSCPQCGQEMVPDGEL